MNATNTTKTTVLGKRKRDNYVELSDTQSSRKKIKFSKYDDIIDILKQFSKEDDVNVIRIIGILKHFCKGNDINVIAIIFTYLYKKCDTASCKCYAEIETYYILCQSDEMNRYHKVNLCKICFINYMLNHHQGHNGVYNVVRYQTEKRVDRNAEINYSFCATCNLYLHRGYDKHIFSKFKQ